MWILIDLAIAAIIVVSAVLAARRGLIGTLFNLVGAIAAIILSVVLCTPVSGYIDNNFVNPAVKNYIIGTVESTALPSPEGLTELDKARISEKIRQMPDSLRSALELADIDPQKIIDEVTSGVDVEAVIDGIASPISSAISRVVAFVILFLVLFVALWVAAKLLTVVFGVLPMGKTLNKVGGIAFGVLRGILIVFVISTFFTAMSKSVDPNSNNLFSQKTINSTYLLKTASDLDPIASSLNIK